MIRTRFAALAFAVVLAAVGLGSVTYFVARDGRPGSMMDRRADSPNFGGRNMMGGGMGLPGGGRAVDSLDAARARAKAFADRLGLVVGEVIWFSNGFYAEIVTADDQGATEVLIDPASGAVHVEPGPAMMWNTRYGMHRGAEPATVLAKDQAQVIAQQWLDDAKPGQSAGPAEVFPGYVTFDTTRDGKTVGMMSVNSATGAVWYHTWHGDFISSSED